MKKNNLAPAIFSSSERQQLARLLDSGRNWTKPYCGNWKANWLLSDIHSDIWILKTPESRKVNNVWRGVVPINWKIELANNSGFLTDSVNRSVLETLQKAAFLMRFLPNHGIDSNGALIQWITVVTMLTEYLYLHSNLYKPQKNYFKLVDRDALIDIASLYVKGGKIELLQYPQRCLLAFYREALNDQPSLKILANPYNVPNKDKTKIIAWLMSAGVYDVHKYRGTSCRFISRPKLNSLLSLGEISFKVPKFSAFLRQFEPELLAINDSLLLPVNPLGTEYPSHSVPTIAEVVRSNISAARSTTFVYTIKQLFGLHKHIEYALPAIDEFDFKRIGIIASKGSAPLNGTPMLPLKFALKYTAEALRWVIVYGDHLVDFYLKALRQLSKDGLFINIENVLNRSEYYDKARERNSWVNANLPEPLLSLGIDGWTSHFICDRPESVFERFRAQPSINDAVQVLIGAITVLIAITKPSRVGELIHLKKNCLYMIENDGYWLRTDLEKANVGDLQPEFSRPIPAVTAKAVQLVVRLGDALTLYSDSVDTVANQYLFYLPALTQSASLKPQLPTRTVLEANIDRFCDFVNLPLDDMGRRWYIRIHETRKLFLITFFWCFKYASLDAARWMAGHSLEEDVYSYIEANFPGEELSHIEAEYASQQLSDFMISGKKGELSNVQALYRAVCSHFRVADLTIIRKNELDEWLEFAFSKGIYKIEPYSIKSAKFPRTTIAVRIEKESRNQKANAN